ncbi:ISXO2-like transposase domain [Cinara cedri]|uniref:ISXO2-like transposase domain n=1 Tax=Cinara cedri TaxID=506608 RepID=A0A5E4M4C8_9HEMI|nr:ISXO2-like transposase domain [Cinara cedri]
MFVLELPTQMAMERTGKSIECVTDWFKMCREVCTAVLKTKKKVVENAQNPIQIDEARFAGRRKYNRDRLLAGDAPPSLKDISAKVINNRNHGARVRGSRVFGLKNGNDCRYFYVHRRDRETLLPIIERECEAGSEIHSDEWAAYKCLTTFLLLVALLLTGS